MDWFVRFLLGFPAREEDFQAIGSSIPELLKDTQSDERVVPKRKRDGLDGVARFEEWSSQLTDPRMPTRRLLIGQITEWLAIRENLDPGTINNELSICPLTDCPLKSGLEKTVAESEPHQQSLEDEVKSQSHMNLVRLSGSIRSTEKAFLELVNQVHRGAGEIQTIWITDPYIFAEKDTTGKGSVVAHLNSYLNALHIDEHSIFNLFWTGSPKGSSKNQSRYEEMLNKSFPGCSFNRISQSLSFHDRLFIAKHKGDDIRGIAGPSLNGWKSDDVVVLSQLEMNDSFRSLMRHLDG